MIFYFSGTGNTKYVAERIAAITGEKLVNMADCNKKMRYDFKLQKGERIGFIYPIYYWSLPSAVEEFLKSFSLEKYGKHYTYSVATCGVATGGADIQLSKMLARKGIALNASFSVRMVDNYTIVFNVKDGAKNKKKNDEAKESIENIAFLIKTKTSGNHNKVRGIWPASKITKKAYDLTRITSPFKVAEDCIGCGLCAKNCPSGAISMEYGKPIWKNPKCTLCFSCLHRCPVNAITYGPTTKRNGQYIFNDGEEK